jgi:hypothetical protein
MAGDWYLALKQWTVSHSSWRPFSHSLSLFCLPLKQTVNCKGSIFLSFHFQSPINHTVLRGHHVYTNIYKPKAVLLLSLALPYALSQVESPGTPVNPHDKNFPLCKEITLKDLCEMWATYFKKEATMFGITSQNSRGEPITEFTEAARPGGGIC